MFQPNPRPLPFLPLHDPSLVREFAAQEIDAYRAKLLRNINFVRLAFTLLLSFSFFMLDSDFALSPELLRIQELEFNLSLFFWLLLAVYVGFLLASNVWLRHWGVRAGLFVGVAVVESVLLSLLVGMLFEQAVVNVGMVIILCSLLLSVLTLTFYESVATGVALGGMLFVYYLLVLVLPQVGVRVLEEQSQWQRFREIFGNIRLDFNGLIEPILFSVLLALLVIGIGFLASQARDNKILSELNYFYNKQLRQLNDSIIEDIQSGLLVVNRAGVVITLNQQARKIFNIAAEAVPPRELVLFSEALAKRFARWIHLQFSNVRTIDLPKGQYSVSFNTLHQHRETELTLITLEGIEESMERVRETRLASLGRLTASIAHEIRNPLASVQSAADILMESSEDKQVNFLAEKIINNAKRMNVIISDILNLFQSASRNKRLIHLNTFIKTIVSQASSDALTKAAVVRMHLDKTQKYSVYFDEGHLSQILNNFIMNSIRYAGVEQVEIDITTQVSEVGRLIYLDVADNGKGVAEEDRDLIFEPFFSKHNKGTGLGLYLVREMCLANQAQIVYVPRKTGACFRIIMERFIAQEAQKTLNFS